MFTEDSNLHSPSSPAFPALFETMVKSCRSFLLAMAWMIVSAVPHRPKPKSRGEGFVSAVSLGYVTTKSKVPHSPALKTVIPPLTSLIASSADGQSFPLTASGTWPFLSAPLGTDSRDEGGTSTLMAPLYVCRYRCAPMLSWVDARGVERTAKDDVAVRNDLKPL